MNLRRIFRSPLAWIVIAVIAIGLLIDFSQRVTSGYKDAPTSQVVSIINGNEPLSEVILIDKEQEIRVTLKDANKTGYKATWVGNQSDELIPRLNERVAAKTLDQWKGENATPGFFSSLLAVLLPAELRPRWRQPGHAVRQVESQDCQQGHPEDHIP
jgi:cell division protease FtsH